MQRKLLDRSRTLNSCNSWKRRTKQANASLGTAAMIAYYWLQREEDIISTLTWNQYRPVDTPDVARIFHHKTGELVDIPLFDEDGTVLWPELMDAP